MKCEAVAFKFEGVKWKLINNSGSACKRDDVLNVRGKSRKTQVPSKAVEPYRGHRKVGHYRCGRGHVGLGRRTKGFNSIIFDRGTHGLWVVGFHTGG